MNRNTEKRPPAFLTEISEKGEISAPDYTSLVNDVTQSLDLLAEHLEILKGQLDPILKHNPPCEPTTKETGVPVGQYQSQFRTDMGTISSVIRLITDEVRCISREVDL